MEILKGCFWQEAYQRSTCRSDSADAVGGQTRHGPQSTREHLAPEQTKGANERKVQAAVHTRDDQLSPLDLLYEYR